jgi:hypothetical protein
VPFALLGCGALLWWFIRAQPWRETDPTRQVALGVLAVIGLHSMVEYPLWYGPFQLAVVLCVWLLWRRPETVTRIEQFTLQGLVLQVSAATIVIAFLAAVGWDYWRINQIYLQPQARNPSYRENTLEKIRHTWLFRGQVEFAELTTTTLTRDNAVYHHDMAQRMLHFSPESRVVEKLIESAVMQGRDEEALFYLQRYKVAFPDAHARWANPSGGDKAP